VPGHIIGHQEFGRAAEERKHPDVGLKEARKILGEAGLGVGVVGGPEGRDKQVTGTHLAGLGIGEAKSVASPIQEQLLTQLVFLAHDDVHLLAPFPETLAVPAVLEAVGELGFVFLPQQPEGDVLVPELALHSGPVRNPLRISLQGSPLPIESAFQLRLAHRGG